MEKTSGVFGKIFVGILAIIGIFILLFILGISKVLFGHGAELNNLQQESISLVTTLSGSSPQLQPNDCRDVELRNECYITTGNRINFSAVDATTKQKLLPGDEIGSYTYPSEKYYDKLIRMSYYYSGDNVLNTYYIDK